jgi:hypothetical protein
VELIAFNRDLDTLGIIESYEYLRWTRKYSDCGSFELKAITTADNITLLKIGNILWKNNDEEAGIIELVEMSDFITISGRFATSFWHVELLQRLRF